MDCPQRIGRQSAIPEPYTSRRAVPQMQKTKLLCCNTLRHISSLVIRPAAIVFFADILTLT